MTDATAMTSMVASDPALPIRPHKRKVKTAVNVLAPTSNDRDDQIMNTNNSSIVSKRAVEKSYFPGEDYFRPFVKKYQRRAPVINRGYWLRMKAIDHTVHQFMQEVGPKHKLVVNLGCGYDPLPFRFLGRHPDLCRSCTFVDVDYPALLRRKVDIIQKSDVLRDLLPQLRVRLDDDVKLASAVGYRAVGCDLRQLDVLEAALRETFSGHEGDIAILFVAEVSVAYMDKAPANALLEWARRLVPDSRFCLLEQHLPDGRDHPFAHTMLKHFEKLRAPLNAIGTTTDMKQRFRHAGWPAENTKIKTLWELWGDPSVVPPLLKHDLDLVEPFDEWEEFALFGAHYFLLVAKSSVSLQPSPHHESATWSLQARTQASRPPYHCTALGVKTQCRRFGAAFELTKNRGQASHTFIHCGGHGVRERLATSEVYTDSECDHHVGCTSIPSALVCHTVTSFGTPDRPLYLLCGGRTSPDKPSSSCWLLKDGTWSRQADMPRPRYRHCAVASLKVSSSNATAPTRGVLIYGGRTNDGEVLGDFLWWDPDHGWQAVDNDANISLEARFSAAMMSFRSGPSSGLLTGGMGPDGKVFDGYWTWQLSASEGGNITIKISMLGDLRGRFGAAMVQHGSQTLLIGGIAAGPLLTHSDEIVELYDYMSFPVLRENRPLLVGFCAISIPGKAPEHDELLILGGGATCFSFGTYLNRSVVLRQNTSGRSWRTLDALECQTSMGKGTVPTSMVSLSSTPPDYQIDSIKIDTAAVFDQLVNSRRTAVIRGVDIGPCVQLWTPDYLRSKIGQDRQVTIHECPTSHMSFSDRNFKYTKTSFSDFLLKAEAGQHVYLRALSSTKPADRAADLATDYPEIASDFTLPDTFSYANRNQHSSPLRISSAVSMWLHYDVMANVLVQVHGSKTLILFPPSDVTNLDFLPGASSSSLNPFETGSEDHAGLAASHAHHVELRAGDILFLPPMWLHAAKPSDGISVAVNVFFRDDEMENAYAAGRDVYGNRDLAAYEHGRRDVSRMIAAFDGVPDDVRRFYLERLAGELRAGSKAG